MARGTQAKADTNKATSTKPRAKRPTTEKKTATRKKTEATVETMAINFPEATTEVANPAPVVQKVLYANAGDEMMTVVHLYPSRTPVSYGNHKKKVFERFGDRFSLSVREFEQEFAPAPVANALLEQRLLVVGDDCPQEIRDRMGLNYGTKELLDPVTAQTLVSLPADELCEVFRALCMEHKRLAIKLFADDFEKGGRNCQRDKLLKLNEVSKEFVEPGERGMCADLLDEITRKEEKSY